MDFAPTQTTFKAETQDIEQKSLENPYDSITTRLQQIADSNPKSPKLKALMIDARRDLNTALNKRMETAHAILAGGRKTKYDMLHPSTSLPKTDFGGGHRKPIKTLIDAYTALSDKSDYYTSFPGINFTIIDGSKPELAETILREFGVLGDSETIDDLKSGKIHNENRSVAGKHKIAKRGTAGWVEADEKSVLREDTKLNRRLLDKLVRRPKPMGSINHLKTNLGSDDVEISAQFTADKWRLTMSITGKSLVNAMIKHDPEASVIPDNSTI